MNLNEYRTKPRGLADLLLAESLIEDGVLLQNDGSLLAAWSFNGPDLEASEPAHLNALVQRLSSAMRLGSGWMIHCDVIRSVTPGYPPRSPFPDPVSALIDEERRVQFTDCGALYRSRYYLALTWLPPLEKAERTVSWFVDGKRVLVDIGESNLRTFRAQIAKFENVFSALVESTRLKSVRSTDAYGFPVAHDELLRYLHQTITGNDHSIRLPDVPTGLADLVLSTEDFTAAPTIGRKHIRVIAIDGLPKASQPGILAALDQLALEYRWSTRAILADSSDAGKLLEAVRVGWRAKKRGWFSKIMRPDPRIGEAENLHAAAMELDAQEAEAVAEANEVQFCLYTSVIILLDEDATRLRESVRTVQSTVQNLGFGCRLETINAIDAWLGSIPGNGYANVRRTQIHTLNLADFLPLTSVWTGLDVNPSRLMPPDSPALLHAVTTGETPFRLHLHVADRAHSLLIGPSGAGKSTALGLMSAQWFRYPKAQVFAIDWDYSIWLLSHALGGRHYDLMSAADLAFCPLRHLEDSEAQAWAAGWIEDLCRLNRMTLTPEKSNHIVDAVSMLASPRNRMRTLTDFVNAVQDADVRQALMYYTTAGPLGQMLDADQDSLPVGGSRMIAFETKSLMESSDPRGSLPVLLYLFRRIEQRLDGSPTLIIIDEAWSALRHEFFRERLHKWLKTVRRRNAVVILATQQISDFANSPIADTILTQTATKLLLPDSEAKNSDTAAFYKRLGLTDREISIIANATPKREYYITSQDGHRRLINFVFGPAALAFCGTNSVPERERAKRLMSAYPDTWQADWLRHNGVEDWAALLDESLKGVNLECATA